MWFKKQQSQVRTDSFEYLDPGDRYFDTACQSLRPKEVLDAETTYYKEYNACGGRVQYAWGEKVDDLVEQTRKDVLRYLGLSAKEYTVAFSLNTTYAINLVTLQLQKGSPERVVTTEIEHNSVFLPSIALAKRWQVPRDVLTREANGDVAVANLPEAPVFFCANATSNIDGRSLGNLAEVVAHVRKHGGISLIDAAQTAAHHPELIKAAQPDIVVFSGHKLYAPSLGVLVVRKSLAFDWTITGGGMVADVQGDTIEFLPAGEPALFEPGLQQWAGIIGLKAALEWLARNPADPALETLLHETLHAIPGLQFVYDQPTTTVSFWTEKMGSHILAKTLSAQGIMCRSGYFCCHHYLKHVLGLPPLLRVSLGRHSTAEDVRALGDALTSILRYLK